MKTNTKKVLSLVMVFLFIFSFYSNIYADGKQNSALKDKEIKIKINDKMQARIRRITEADVKEDVMNKITNYKENLKTSSEDISPLYVPDPGDGSTIISGPVKKYSDNRLSSAIIKTSCDAAIFLVPSGILLYAAKNAYTLVSATIAYLFLNTYLSDVGNEIPLDNYYEVWQWKHYSTYWEADVVMTTIVFYSDPGYSNPVTVEAYETDIIIE